MANKGSFHKILAVISFVSVGFVFITTTSTYAGFEWVPAPQNAAPEPNADDLAPVAIPEPAPAPAPVTVMPAPEPIAPEPLEVKDEVAAPAPSTMKIIRVQQPKPDVAPPPPAPVQTKVIVPDDAPEFAPQAKTEVKETVSWDNDRVEVRAHEADVVVEETPAPQPKIIVPEDAPESALMNAENSEKIRISATPNLPDVVQQTEFEEAVGFGNNMPLGFALSQVVPEGYAYSFGKGVNAAAIVSWSGGKAWNMVVADMVQPLGLSVSIQDKKVLIYDPAQATQEHSSAADTPAPEVAPVEMAEIEEAPKRLNIVVPTEESSTQPEETMVKIERIAQQAQQETGEPIALIEPTSGDAHEDAISATTESGDYKKVRFWEAKKGQSVKDVLDEWAQNANVELVWEAPHDFTLANNLLISDSFENAIRTVLTQALEEERPPSITLMETPGAETSATLVVKG